MSDKVKLFVSALVRPLSQITGKTGEVFQDAALSSPPLLFV